ncbi:uncharacterized protein LOC114191066 isoform X2 [Vigna unguiculata]|uniref:uncharacterized protein LOC114191066 isoform X2 n=1 Tax=Vigna unguiculata TaxID=3917 RepID=UPI0010161AD6|nr:uncharacterized protein LOC114191066 isoform X2 [Vigna unguiculata]
MRTHEGTTKEGKEKGAVTPLNQRPDGAATRSDRNCDVDERSYGVEGVIVARHGIGDESEDLAWHGIVSWTWDAQDETCGICRMAFDGCCPDCKLPGDDCPLSSGHIVRAEGSLRKFLVVISLLGPCLTNHQHCVNESMKLPSFAYKFVGLWKKGPFIWFRFLSTHSTLNHSVQILLIF